MAVRVFLSSARAIKEENELVTSASKSNMIPTTTTISMRVSTFSSANLQNVVLLDGSLRTQAL